MPELTDLRPSDPVQIAGYRVLGRLGAGGQGVVYLALTPNNERVAIKQLLAGFATERDRQRFAQEVAAVRRVAPFCTAPIVDVQLDGSVPYVVSEYIDGLSLKQQIDRHGPMSGPPLQRLALGTATVLAAIHQAGVVHRDFKPANVMLAADGPRVIDFGIAGPMSTEATLSNALSGTPNYMSPEHLRVERVGPAGDVFAWGSVITYAATGHPPFEAEHVMAVMHRIGTAEPDLTGVPAELLGLLRRCLDKNPDRRPTAGQALALLSDLPVPLPSLPSPVVPVPAQPAFAQFGLALPAPRGSGSEAADQTQPLGLRFRRRRELLLGQTAAGVLLVVGLAVGGWMLAAGPGSSLPATAEPRPAASPSRAAIPQPAATQATKTSSADPTAPSGSVEVDTTKTNSDQNGDQRAERKGSGPRGHGGDGKRHDGHSGRDDR